MFRTLQLIFKKKYDNVTKKGLAFQEDGQKFFEVALFEIDLPTKKK